MKKTRTGVVSVGLSLLATILSLVSLVSIYARGLGQVEGTVKALEGKVKALEGNVEALEGNVEALEGNVEEILASQVRIKDQVTREVAQRWDRLSPAQNIEALNAMINRVWINMTKTYRTGNEAQNHCSYPIEVAVTVSRSEKHDICALSMYVNGKRVVHSSVATQRGYCSGTMTVPPGAFYRVNLLGEQGDGRTVLAWHELRGKEPCPAP